jgi:hypothetical protein
VGLVKSCNVFRYDIFDAPFVDFAIGDVIVPDEFSEPFCGLPVVLVVVGCHGNPH